MTRHRPVSDDAYDRMDERIADHFDRVRALLDDAVEADTGSTEPDDTDDSPDA